MHGPWRVCMYYDVGALQRFGQRIMDHVQLASVTMRNAKATLVSKYFSKTTRKMVGIECFVGRTIGHLKPRTVAIARLPQSSRAAREELAKQQKTRL